MIDLIAHPFAALLYGMAAQIIAGMAEASKPGEPVAPLSYLRERPYRHALGVIAAVAGFAALADTGQLSAVSAFGVGYMGSDALAKLANAAGNRFRKL